MSYEPSILKKGVAFYFCLEMNILGTNIHKGCNNTKDTDNILTVYLQFMLKLVKLL
jgi:hypothetical protein